MARGVCEIENGMLTGVTERTKIYKKGADAEYTEDGVQFFPLAGDTIVSMNLWGFSACVLDELWNRMGAFLNDAIPANPLKCEYFLPFVVNAQLADKSASVQVLPCEEAWYRRDLPRGSGFGPGGCGEDEDGGHLYAGALDMTNSFLCAYQ